MDEFIPPDKAARLGVRALVEPRAPAVLSPEQGSALDEAQRVLGLARAALDEARAQAEALRARAVEEGRAEGLREVSESLGRARAEYDGLMARAEGDVVGLGLELARRLVGRALEVEPGVLAEMVGQVLPLVQARRQVVVKVCAEDWEGVEEARGRLEARHGRALRVEVVPAVPRGVCWLDTEAGRVEVGLEAQLRALEAAMLGSSGEGERG